MVCPGHCNGFRLVLLLPALLLCLCMLLPCIADLTTYGFSISTPESLAPITPERINLLLDAFAQAANLSSEVKQLVTLNLTKSPAVDVNNTLARRLLAIQEQTPLSVYRAVFAVPPDPADTGFIGKIEGNGFPTRFGMLSQSIGAIPKSSVTSIARTDDNGYKLPGTTVRIPAKPKSCAVDVCFLVDISPSISDPADGGYAGAIEVQQELVDALVQGLVGSSANVAAVAFAGTINILQPLTPVTAGSLDTILASIRTKLSQLDSTRVSDGLAACQLQLAGSASAAARHKQVIALLTDGGPTGGDTAEAVEKAVTTHPGFAYFTIAFGTKPDLDLLKRISDRPVDRHWVAGMLGSALDTPLLWDVGQAMCSVQSGKNVWHYWLGRGLLLWTTVVCLDGHGIASAMPVMARCSILSILPQTSISHIRHRLQPSWLMSHATDSMLLSVLPKICAT